MRVVVSKSLITAVAVVVLCLLSFGAHGASADLTLTFSNDSGANVTGLVVYLTGDAQAKVVHTAAPGCGTPDITYLLDSGMAAFIDFGGRHPHLCLLRSEAHSTTRSSLRGQRLVLRQEQQSRWNSMRDVVVYHPAFRRMSGSRARQSPGKRRCGRTTIPEDSSRCSE